MLAPLIRTAPRRFLPSRAFLRTVHPARATSTMAVNAVPSLTLTESEQRLVDLLTACADWVDANPRLVDQLRLKDDNGNWIGKERGSEPVELRIAGGWVRDKVSTRSLSCPALLRVPSPPAHCLNGR